MYPQAHLPPMTSPICGLPNPALTYWRSMMPLSSQAKVGYDSCLMGPPSYSDWTTGLSGMLCFVVEYMDGGSLQDIIDTGGCNNHSVLANICYQVLKVWQRRPGCLVHHNQLTYWLFRLWRLQGLEFIHSCRQIHRDIKPSNLLINHTGAVKVSDFRPDERSGLHRCDGVYFCGYHELHVARAPRRRGEAFAVLHLCLKSTLPTLLPLASGVHHHLGHLVLWAVYHGRGYGPLPH